MVVEAAPWHRKSTRSGHNSYQPSSDPETERVGMVQLPRTVPVPNKPRNDDEYHDLKIAYSLGSGRCERQCYSRSGGSLVQVESGKSMNQVYASV